jgi:glycosyltransferase involved in cell wall biosynthesis
MAFVSVITSTCNRFRFIPRLIEMYKSQTYPKEKMEWLILDDGEMTTAPLFTAAAAAGLPNIHYMPLDTKETMGKKLNMLKAAATGDIVVVMDDDDYYPPQRVSSVVEAFEKSPKKQLAGTSLVYMYYTDTDEIYATGPYHNRHALNCTLAWRRGYGETHEYDDAERCAVEAQFLENFTKPMVQLDPKQTILHVIHSTNTFNAIKARERHTLGLQKTELTLADFMAEKSMRLAFIGAY